VRLSPGITFGGDGDSLEARFRESERRGRRAQGLETDLLQGVREEPALELDVVFGGTFAGPEFVQGGFGAVDDDFVVDDRGFEGRDEFEQIGPKRGSRFTKVSRRRGPGAMRPTCRSPWRGSSSDPENSKWGAGNLQTGAPANSFVSGRTHKSSLLSTASSRSACHPIAIG
jgi:hypothetical protein